MKIAYIIPSLDKKGPIIFTDYLIKSLNSEINNITVFYFHETPEKLELGVKCIKISFFSSFDFDDFDIVHSTMLLPDLYVFLHRERIKNKTVISMHNIMHEDIGMYYKPLKAYIIIKLWKYILSRAIPIIVSSEEMKSYYAKLLSKKNKFRIIPYGIQIKEYNKLDTNIESGLRKLQEQYTVIGTVGLTIRRKGFEQLIEFLKNNKNYAVIVIGDGKDTKKLLNYAKEEKITNRFFITGFKSNSYNFFQFIDIYAHTSYSEGFGLSMLEALSHGIPLVCSKLHIYKEYISDEDVCYFEPGNIESLTYAIKKISKSLKKYREKSLNLYREKFTLEKMGNSHLAFYEEIIAISKS